MNKSIKALIEDYVLAFNPTVLDDDKPKRKISRDDANDIIGLIPETKEKLLEIILLRCIKNPTNPYLLNIDTSKIKDMSELFKPLYNEYKIFTLIEELDLHTWNTSNVTNMLSMFDTCTNLRTLNLSGFDTRKVTSMFGMFLSCHKLSNLDISTFDTTKVTNMGLMFSGCAALREIDLSNFNTNAVTDAHGMFFRCIKLETIDFSYLKFKKKTNINNIVNFCSPIIQAQFTNHMKKKK